MSVNEKAYQVHKRKIEEWIQEAKEDYPDVHTIELAHDIVISYISAEVGDHTPMADEIRRRMLGL